MGVGGGRVGLWVLVGRWGSEDNWGLGGVGWSRGERGGGVGKGCGGMGWGVQKNSVMLTATIGDF